jgi:hypothetical protein
MSEVWGAPDQDQDEDPPVFDVSKVGPEYWMFWDELMREQFRDAMQDHTEEDHAEG